MNITKPFNFFISCRQPSMIPIALLLKNDIERQFSYVCVNTDVMYVHKDIEQDDCNAVEPFIAAAHAIILLIDSGWMPQLKDQSQAVTQDSNLFLSTALNFLTIQEVDLSQNLPLPDQSTNDYGLTTRTIIPVFVDCLPTFEQFALPAELKSLSTLKNEHIRYANWLADIGPLLNQLAIRSKLRRPSVSNDDVTLNRNNICSQALNTKELKRMLSFKEYNGWHIENTEKNGTEYLIKKFKFNTFEQAIDFLQQVSVYCRLLDHHPDWRNTHQFVSVALNTWDAQRRITHLDLNLALVMNKIEVVILGE